jgi:hypothetical protein
VKAKTLAAAGIKSCTTTKAEGDPTKLRGAAPTKWTSSFDR